MQKKALVLAALLGLFAAGDTLAGDTISISNAWARATPPGLDKGAGYLAIQNRGETLVRLTGASTEAAREVQIHRSRETDGQMRMQAVEGGIRVPAGESVTLAPMGYHLMLMGLQAPLRAGDRIPLTLEFSNHERVNTSLDIRPADHDSRTMDHSQ